jgi:hypothetical protein
MLVRFAFFTGVSWVSFFKLVSPHSICLPRTLLKKLQATLMWEVR